MVKVWVNGSFDVIHIGHLKLLEFASSIGEVYVGIDSDDRIKKLKGDKRPFNNEHDRKFFLESIKYVKEVVVFESESRLESLIELIKPKYMIIGDDYKNKKILGSQFFEKIVFFERLKNYSTTKILDGTCFKKANTASLSSKVPVGLFGLAIKIMRVLAEIAFNIAFKSWP